MIGRTLMQLAGFFLVLNKTYCWLLEQKASLDECEVHGVEGLGTSSYMYN